MDLHSYLRGRVEEIEASLEGFLPRETELPISLHRAMRYSVFAGGKRLRPILCLAGAEAVGGRGEAALRAACAVECVHTYSLIHDDLPCMDNDDLRRGKPTCHKVFGEAVALLAGDALLALAFEILAGAESVQRGRMVGELAKTAGSRWLVGGQVADMEAEKKEVSLEEVQFIHRGKTAAMLAASLRLGAMSVDGSEEWVDVVGDFGWKLGLAFQIQDDILDMTQGSEVLGKSAGKDVAVEKATYPRVMGLDKAREEAERMTEEAIAALRPLGDGGEVLREIAGYLLERKF